jgi:glutathione reductase (NADPH)
MSIATQKGVQFRFNTLPERIEKQADGSLLMHCAGGRTIKTDLLLWAVGRVPNSEGLGLEALGIAPGPNGAVAVDAASNAGLPWLHAVGDVTDRINLTPVAIDEGRAFADSTYGNLPRRVNHDLVASAVFSQPELATVGLEDCELCAEWPCSCGLHEPDGLRPFGPRKFFA